ncbi:hypothetical protein DB459_16055 [Bradyrhizobium sp. WD16]|nr:hypothetical protein DB459_16055 [Bradyrhizobium sp. WD16]
MGRSRREIWIGTQPHRIDNLYAPVGGQHRTRGRFDAASADEAIAMSGSVVRRAPILIAALAMVIMERLTKPKRPRPPASACVTRSGIS